MKKLNAAFFSILLLISVISGFVLWQGLVLPQERWEVKTMSEPEPAGNPGFVPLQFQLLPWQSGFIADKNKPVRGLSLGYLVQQNDIDGVSMALMHSSNARKRGLSFSLIELSGESSGVAFFLAGGSVGNNGFSVGLWNMAECNRGVQLGIINQEQDDIIAEYGMKPKADKGFGVQAGVVNYSDGRGIQFGLWNTNPNSFFKHFPLINFCF